MPFLSRKPKEIGEKQGSEQPKASNHRGHALTEEMEGFKNLFWP